MNTKTKNIIRSVLYIVLGILFALSVIDPASMINWMVAVVCLLGGVALLAIEVATNKSLITGNGMMGALLIAFGVFFLPPVGTLSIDWCGGIALVLICIGLAMTIDAILGLAFKRGLTGNIIKLVIGLVAATFGFLLYFLGEFRKFAGLVLGIVVIVYGVILLVETLTGKTIVVVKKK